MERLKGGVQKTRGFKMRIRFNNFTDAKHIPLENYKDFIKIENMIEKTTDENLLEDSYRMLAYLMQKIIIKRKKLWGIKK